MKKHYRHEKDCLNCGTILEGKFCHNCGQENLQMKESFGHMITHAVSDYFHFDDQFFHTLKPLFLQPGKLTNEYVAGRRAQYLHPVKMYIFISLLFFIIFFQDKRNEPLQIRDDSQTEHVKIDKAKKAIVKGVNSDTSLNAAQKRKVANRIIAFMPDSLQTEIQENIKKDSIKEHNKKVFKDGDDFAMFSDASGAKTYAEYEAAQNKLPENKRDGLLTHYFYKKNFDWRSHGKDAKEMLVEGLKHNAPKMMFLLLPLFAFILKLAFWKNRKFYVEHIIYAIHVHCYLFLFLTFTTLIKLFIPHSWQAPIAVINLLTFAIVVWYIYRSLRVVYQRSRWRTISKMIGVGFMYSILFGFCFMVILFITALTTV
ncbi:DUF3667 domain-containing protein [Mucilaginibacter sp.]|uniref:DUF3667 domain-containing protein n=1 Tax=Mucilaginibacter sp. TaxID=1882438 RepID=UPI0035BC53F7